MASNSQPVKSNQPSLHPRLADIVQRHLEHEDKTPPRAESLAAYRQLCDFAERHDWRLVLDSFCGTGLSTAQLAHRHPGSAVVGVDKSLHRLGRHERTSSDNYLLLQARCEDIWTLLHSDQRRLTHHYLLYPNPWPKSGHLQRRIHGHGSFPTLVALGGAVELRSNWKTYIEEFGVAMHLAGQRGCVSRLPDNGHDLTLHERKYRHSGHPLWSYRATMAP